MGLFSRFRSTSAQQHPQPQPQAGPASTRGTNPSATAGPSSAAYSRLEPKTERSTSSPAYLQPQAAYQQDVDRRRSTSPVASMASRSGSRMSRWLPGGRNRDRNGSIDWSKGHADPNTPRTNTVVPANGRPEPPRELHVSTKHANAGPAHGSTPSPTSPMSISGSRSTPLLSLAAGDGLQRPSQAKRLSSSDWRQEGGIIGKLNFELSTSPPSEIKYPWLSRSSEFVAGGGDSAKGADVPSAAGYPVQPQSTAASPSINSVLALPQVVPDQSEAVPPRPDKAPAEVQPSHTAGQMEVLESPEKSKKWKGRVRSRRSSLTPDGKPEKPQSPGSPTPRKVSLPVGNEAPRMSTSTSGQGESRSPRVPNLRRPSSTLFSFPFHRSASRASLYNDLDSVPVDDGSFQLKGFRHVSGVTDVEGAGGLEGYLSHVKRQSAANLLDQQQDTATASTPPTSQVASPVTGLQSRRPSASPLSPPVIRPGMSRPPSVAGSLASMDDHMISGPRVSAAAFRRGIRRPSEGPFTAMSDVGHGSPAGPEDEDDLPLAVRFGKDGRRPSNQSLPKATLDSPVADQTGLSGTTSSIERPGPGVQLAQAPKATPQAATTPTHSRHASASGFVVKSRPTSPEPPKQTPSIHTSDAYQPVFHSPPISRSHTPLQAASHTSNFVASPVSLNFSERSAAPSPGNPISQAEQQAASPVRDTATVAPAFATRVPVPPPVAPVQVPEPVVLPSELPNLPLPPDEMPPTPPKTGQRLPSQLDPSARVSPTAAKRRSAILDEPKRILSGLWAAGGASANGNRAEDDREDGFDPALVVSSMKALGEPSRRSDERGARQRTVSGPRSPVEARLAAASAALNSAVASSRPGLAPLNTQADGEDSDDHATEKMRSPVSETSTVAGDSTSFASSFVRPRRTGRTSAAGSAKAKKASWSSSEDESDSDVHQKSSNARRTSASRKTKVEPSPPARKKRDDLLANNDETASSEEEPLSQLKARASQLNLLLTSESPSKETKAVSPPRSITSPSSRTNVSASQITLSPPVADPAPRRPGLPSSRSVSFSDSPPSSKAPPPPRLRPQAPTSRSDVSPARNSASLGPVHPIRNLSASELRSTASPASSRSALTGDSSILPTTPSEGSIARGSTGSGAQVPDAMASSFRPSDSNMADGLSASAQHDQRRRSMSQTQNAYPSAAAPHMDQAAWHAFMKQQWQAQYMAAAYRASEDEWERQSNASAHPAASSPPAPVPHMPPFPVGPYNMSLPPGFQLPMPYGYPSFPGGPMPALGQPGMPFGGSPQFVPQHLPGQPPAGFPYFPTQQQAPFGFMTPSPSLGPSGGGLYSYGTGSQSVFGGDFGPPAFPAGAFMAGSHGSPGATMSDVAGPSAPVRDRRMSTQSQSFETSRVHRPGQQRPGHTRRKSDLRFEADSTVHEGDESEQAYGQPARASAPVPPPRTASFSPPSSPPSSWRRSTADFRTGGASMAASASVAGGEDLAATPRAKPRTRTYFAS